jgi:hypothetical protein
MKHLLTLEELAQCILGILLFGQLPYAWWVFPATLLLPDLSMLGYIFGPKIGAISYNFFHHKLLAVLLIGLGYLVHMPLAILAGSILLAHAALDRVFGYGLKFFDDFRHTHLGWIGKASTKN